MMAKGGDHGLLPRVYRCVIGCRLDPGCVVAHGERVEALPVRFSPQDMYF
jgi:hypothetical protein